MRTSTRRTLLAGAAAGLSLTLVAPAVSANASELHRSGPQHRGSAASHEMKGRHLGQNKAMKTLRQALRLANAQYRLSVRSARLAFAADPAVVAAKAKYLPVIETSTVAADIVAAWDGFAADTTAAASTRDGKIAQATTTWITTTEAAYAAFDQAVAPTEVKARADYRDAVRTATMTFMTTVKGAQKTFADSTELARATERALINQAKATFAGSNHDAAATLALQTAIEQAEAAFHADATVVAAAAARQSTIQTARDTFRASMITARAAFVTATGHAPVRGMQLLPNAHL